MKYNIALQTNSRSQLLFYMIAAGRSSLHFDIRPLCKNRIPTTASFKPGLTRTLQVLTLLRLCKDRYIPYYTSSLSRRNLCQSCFQDPRTTLPIWRQPIKTSISRPVSSLYRMCTARHVLHISRKCSLRLLQSEISKSQF